MITFPNFPISKLPSKLSRSLQIRIIQLRTACHFLILIIFRLFICWRQPDTNKVSLSRARSPILVSPTLSFPHPALKLISICSRVPESGRSSSTDRNSLPGKLSVHFFFTSILFCICAPVRVTALRPRSLA